MLLGALVGCGESGVSTGATVRVYVAPPLCAEAERELGRVDGSAGDVRVAIVCLRDAEAGERLDLAAVGANARRATEDSASIAYLEAPGSAARFSRPILDEAGIAFVPSSSGTTAMASVLQAIEDANTSSLRDSIHSALNKT
ncbi:MAG TPA: hypothetical protein VGO66_02440 [Solirubrobacterales bacterium]|nr:hypothetical protein [Solirubrobacterales bacterium]